MKQIGYKAADELAREFYQQPYDALGSQEKKHVLTVLYLDGILDWLSDKAKLFYNGARTAYQKLAPII